MNNLLAVNWNTVIWYGIYGVTIVVCIVLLVLMRKHGRLPRHPDFKAKLEGLSADVQKLLAEPEGESRYDFFRQVSRALYNADKLQYIATLMAEKERDGDINRVAALLEKARTALHPYKYAGKERSESDGLQEAASAVASAISTMGLVIERDSAIKARKAKK